MSEKIEFKTISELIDLDEKLVEVELMVRSKELQLFATYCIENDIKFNDWIRELALKELRGI